MTAELHCMRLPAVRTAVRSSILAWIWMNVQHVWLWQ
jgi:hypothetical protein